LVGVERKVMMAGRDKDGATVVRHLWRRSPRAVGASTAESDDVRALRKFVFGKIDEAGASPEVQAEKALLSPPAKRFHWKAGLVIDVVHAFANISSSSVRRTSSQAALARASPLSLACVRPAGPRPGRLGRGEPGFAPRAAARLHCCRGASPAAPRIFTVSSGPVAGLPVVATKASSSQPVRDTQAQLLLSLSHSAVAAQSKQVADVVSASLQLAAGTLVFGVEGADRLVVSSG